MNMFQRFVLKVVGLNHYISLFNAFDDACHESENYSAIVYPSGEFHANVTLPDGEVVKTLPFITSEERAAYIMGMKFTVEAMTQGGVRIYDDMPTDDWLEKMSEQDRELLKKKSRGSA